MSKEFASVLSCWSVEEIHLARIHLADEGIESFVFDDQTVAMDWGLANSIHGVKLMVKSEDEARAREILQSPGSFDPANDENEPAEHGAEAQLSDHDRFLEQPLTDEQSNDSPGILSAFRSAQKSLVGLILLQFVLVTVIGFLIVVIQTVESFFER